MKKWYAPSRFLLWSALACQLVGCAQMSQTLSRWTGRDQAEEKLADVDGRAEKAAKTKPDPKVPDAGGKARKPSSDSAIAKADKPSADKAKRSADATIAKTEKTPGEKAKSTADKAAAPTARPNRDVQVAAKPPVGGGTKEPRDPFLDELEARVAESRQAAKSPAGPRTTAAPATGRAESEDSAAVGQVAQASGKTPADGKKQGQIQEVALRQEEPSPNSGLPEWALESVSTTARKPAPGAAAVGRAATKDKRVPSAEVAQLQPGRPAPKAADGAASAAQPQAPKAATNQSGIPAGSLVAVCPEAKGEVRELVVGLESADVEAVKRNIHRLGRMQTHAAAAAPALKKLLSHRDGFIRVHAALALVRIKAMSPEVTETLILGLRSPDPGVRSFAAAVLAELGPNSADALPALSGALHDQDGYVRLHVAEVLIRHADWSNEALQALMECLKDKDENVRWLATYSMAELAPQSPDAVGALARTLSDPTPKVQIGAAYALGEIGPLAKSAAEELKKAQRSQNGELRTAAEYALQQVAQ